MTESDSSPRSRSRALVSVAMVGVLLATAGGGFFLAYQLYQWEIISWSAVSTTMAPTLLAVLGAVIFLVILLAVVRKSGAFLPVFSGSLGLLLGFTGGVVGPGVIGEQAVWLKGPESVIYSLEVDTVAVPETVIDAVNNPLSGTRSTHSYLAPLSDGGFLMASSAGSEIFDLERLGMNGALTSNAMLSRWSDDLEMREQIDLTEAVPEVRLIRSIVYDEDRGILHFAVTPIGQDCLGVQLWEAEITIDPLQVGQATMLYQSVPCLDSTAGPQQFGGRVATDSDGNAYLSIGEFGYGFATTRQERLEGRYAGRPELLQDPSTLGSIVKVAPDGTASVVSRGHRNPQGLFFDEVTGLLWASEHGPKGGDEVNLIQEGNDYGWPDVTYGGPYGGLPQPDSSWQQGRWFGQNHGQFTEPLFSWLPAIAASQMLVYRGDEFPAWQGDILVAAFRGDIHRLRVVGDRVVVNEAIAISERPRDMITLDDGSLLISTDDDELLRLQAAD